MTSLRGEMSNNSLNTSKRSKTTFEDRQSNCPFLVLWPTPKHSPKLTMLRAIHYMGHQWRDHIVKQQVGHDSAVDLLVFTYTIAFSPYSRPPAQSTCKGITQEMS